MPETAIISLSAIPPRFAHLRPTLVSLVNQEPAPAEVRLYLPRRFRRFPDWDGSLPDIPRRVRLLLVDEDLGPGTKILHALQDLAATDPWIAFCDDDCRYPPGWLNGLLAAARAHPGCAISAAGQQIPGLKSRPDRQPRMRRHSAAEIEANRQAAPDGTPPRIFAASGYVDTLAGWAGALVRPSFFLPDVAQVPLPLRAVDDFWLSAQLERNGVPIWLSAEIPPIFRRRVQDHVAPLVTSVIDGMDRNQANAACVDHARRAWGIWPPADAAPATMGQPLAAPAGQAPGH